MMFAKTTIAIALILARVAAGAPTTEAAAPESRINECSVDSDCPEGEICKFFDFGPLGIKFTACVAPDRALEERQLNCSLSDPDSCPDGKVCKYFDYGPLGLHFTACVDL